MGWNPYKQTFGGNASTPTMSTGAGVNAYKKSLGYVNPVAGKDHPIFHGGQVPGNGGGGGGGSPDSGDQSGSGMPTYNPYAERSQLPGNLSFDPERQGYMNFSSIFDQQRKAMGSELDRGFAGSMNRGLTQGGLDSGAIERMTKQSQVERGKALSGLSADQVSQEAQNRYQVDNFNTGQANQASQFNINNILAEGRFGHLSELEKYKIQMGALGAKQSADAMEKEANRPPGFTEDPLAWMKNIYSGG